MGIVLRGMRNVLRNPLRLFLIVLLLGASLMFVATMVSLSDSAQQQLTDVRKSVGTGITVNLVSNSSGGFNNNNNNSTSTPGNTGNNNNGNGNNAGGTNPGGTNPGGTNTGGTNTGGNAGGGGFIGGNSDPIPNATINKVKAVSGVSSVEANLRRMDSSGTLKTGTIQTRDGQTRTRPVIVNGISSGATHFTLTGGTPTVVEGRGFQASDADANVAMMSKTLADDNSLKVGSTITLQDVKITIIGIYTTEQATDSSVTLPLTAMERIFDVDGVDSITAYAASYDQVQTVATALRTALGSTYDVVTQDTFYASTINGISVAQRSIQLALVVSIAIAIVVIIFAVFIIVRERTSEIGTLKAIGASHGQVIRQFWIEVLTLSIMASAVATVFLATLGPMISQMFDISSSSTATSTASNAARGANGGGRGMFMAQTGGGTGGTAGRFGDIHLAAATLNLQTLLIILGLGILLAALTSVIPAWYVSRIKPAVVLRKAF
jgi:putative ABC transport system permease protein